MLPRLSYGKAVGVVTLWGLLFVLVLTMISGARELMTPGAWEKQGHTYRLTQEPASADANSLERARQEKLERLRQALWQYAEVHQGRFPPDRADPWIHEETWEVPDASGLRYVYVPGMKVDQGGVPLVFEPELFGSPRLVLYTNGEIRRLQGEDIVQVKPSEKP